MTQVITTKNLRVVQDKALAKANEIATNVSEYFKRGAIPYESQRDQLVDLCKLMSIQIHANITEQGKTEDKTLQTLLQHYNMKLNEKILTNLRYFDLSTTGADFASHRLLYESNVLKDLTDSLNLMVQMHYFYTHGISKPSVCSSYLNELVSDFSNGQVKISA